MPKNEGFIGWFVVVKSNKGRQEYKFPGIGKLPNKKEIAKQVQARFVNRQSRIFSIHEAA